LHWIAEDETGQYLEGYQDNAFAGPPRFAGARSANWPDCTARASSIAAKIASPEGLEPPYLTGREACIAAARCFSASCAPARAFRAASSRFSSY